MPNQKEPNLRISARSKIRQVDMCDDPPADHTWKPEFYRKNRSRPVVIISKSATLNGVVTVVPLSTKQQAETRHSLKLNHPSMAETAGLCAIIPPRCRPEDWHHQKNRSLVFQMTSFNSFSKESTTTFQSRGQDNDTHRHLL